MEDHNFAYFRNLWQINMSDLGNQCNIWEKICVDNEIPDEVHGEIRTTIGLARLLMDQKLKQFKGLIDDSEFNTGEKEITCSDLQGFWDMVYFEVEKINKRFSKLDKSKNNEWKFTEEKPEKLVQKKVPATKDTTVAKKDDSSKSRALAAKQRLAEFKQKMLAQRQQQKEKTFVEIIQPSKQGLNPTKNVSSDKASAKKSKKKIKKVDCEMRGPDEINALGGECVVADDVPKQKSAQQKSHPVSAQNKENSLPTDDTSNFKNTSASQTKSKVKTKAPTPGKKEIKLQCVTRSAKRAMLAQQNAL